MKYFKVTDLTQEDEEFYISSTLPNETPAHVALTLHLDIDKKYKITEVSGEEFYRETEDVPSTFAPAVDLDSEEDWDYEDIDEGEMYD